MTDSAAVRPTEKRTLHFSLPAARPDEDLTLHVALRSYPMRAHDEQSRRVARETHRFLRGVPDRLLTHFIDVDLPKDAIAMIEVTAPTLVEGQAAERTVHLAIHVPEEGHQRVARRLRSASEAPWAIHPRLEFLRLVGANGFEDKAFPEGIIDWNDPESAAAALLFQHPDLINLSTEQGGEIPAHILEICVIGAIDKTGHSLPLAIWEAGSDWMRTEGAVGPDGKPLIDPTTGERVMTRIISKSLKEPFEGTLAEALRRAKDDRFLKGQQWTVQYGVTTDSYHAKSNRGGVADEALHPSNLLRSGDGAFEWSLKNLTPGNGLSIDYNVQYAPAPSQQTFTVNDIWLETDPLTDDEVKLLLDGKVGVKLTDAAHPDGVATAQLAPAATPVDKQPVDLKATFSGTAKATGTFRVNDLRKALTFSISATGLGASPGGHFFAGEPARMLRSFSFDDASRNGTLTIKCKNEWLRHLSACVQFRDGADKVVSPSNWSHKIPSGLRPIFEQDANTKFVDLVPPVRTVFGVPVPPDPTVVSFPVPPQASKVVIMYGGLGYGGSYDPAVCPVGVALTVIVEMALPVILLLAGTSVTNSKTVVKLLEDKETLFAICTIGGFLVAGGTATYIGTAQDAAGAVKDVAIALGPKLLSPATALGRWIIEKVSEGAAKRAAPFLNVFTTIVDGAVTAAQLSQTICEVLSSPWKYQVELTRSITIDVVISVDPDKNVFPDVAVRYVVSVVYDAGATVPSQEFKMGAGRRHDDIRVTFSGAPAGGRVKAFVFFYADTGWQAAQGESNWYDAKGTDGSRLEMKIQVKNNDVPLSKESVYKYKQKITYDPRLKKHVWLQDEKQRPTDTRVSPSKYPGKVMQRLLSITNAQRPGQMAYAWQASGLHIPADQAGTPIIDAPLYTVQNLSNFDRPEDGYAAPPVGFSIAPGVAYDITSPNDGTGRNFFVDSSRGEFKPEREGSGLHLRRVALKEGSAPDFSTRTDKSWGRFPVAVDRYILHPQGVMIGISYDRHKIFLLTLPDKPSADKDAPVATMASGFGKRDGLMQGPRAIATGLDGRVLILEAGNGRVQAFDINGNPVKYFGANADQPYMPLQEPERSKYLDLAVEAKGYIYVLRIRDDESKPENYMIDLYEPNGNFLVSTPNFAADKITVDLMRNLFSLNYEIILGKDERPEPSVSHWVPPAPRP